MTLKSHHKVADDINEKITLDCVRSLKCFETLNECDLELMIVIMTMDFINSVCKSIYENSEKALLHEWI